MKHSFIIIFSALSLLTAFAACDESGPIVPGTTDGADTTGSDNPLPTGNKISIQIGSSMFTATLYDNATAAAFKALLPMTINMNELNGNEKYFDLSTTLPTNASNPGTIRNGDLMMYGSNTLVLFYKTFSTTYSYTRLGRIDDITGLAAALGGGKVTVTYELE